MSEDCQIQMARGLHLHEHDVILSLSPVASREWLTSVAMAEAAALPQSGVFDLGKSNKSNWEKQHDIVWRETQQK